jgi:hypothetical protein
LFPGDILRRSSVAAYRAIWPYVRMLGATLNMAWLSARLASFTTS